MEELLKNRDSIMQQSPAKIKSAAPHSSDWERGRLGRRGEKSSLREDTP